MFSWIEFMFALITGGEPVAVVSMTKTPSVAESINQAHSGDVQITARAAPLAAPESPLVAAAEFRQSLYNFYVVSFCTLDNR